MLYVDTNITAPGTCSKPPDGMASRRFVFASSSSASTASHQDRRPSPRTTDAQPPDLAPTPRRSSPASCSAPTTRHLYGLRTSCLRFFTVYGPRQRPDLAIHTFTERSGRGQPDPAFGDGPTRRDYTYVDDIVDRLVAAMDLAPGSRSSTSAARRRPRSSIVRTLAAELGVEPSWNSCRSSRGTCRSLSRMSARRDGCWGMRRRCRFGRGWGGSYGGIAPRSPTRAESAAPGPTRQASALRNRLQSSPLRALSVPGRPALEMPPQPWQQVPADPTSSARSL